MVKDRIEQEIVIDAPVERVWAVLTEPEHVGQWFGHGEPPPIDLRPGGVMRLDHGEHGQFPTVFVEVEAPRYLSYRWASGFPGELATESNSTLVEFTLSPEGDGTRLNVVESGFAQRPQAAGPARDDSYESHEGGWSEVLAAVRKRSEKLAV
ncbi:SRPBCC family protein [Amycolatopsis sp. NPDC059021]|uniref:SRPBCC family protein n=1 Tax=Amycolatopsis sp. NPDC059021 TaxID=3346704 RepID=UPI00367349A0